MNYFNIERVLVSFLPIVFLLTILDIQWARYTLLILFLLIIIFSICPSCKTCCIIYSRLVKYPWLSSVFFDEPKLMCPKCGYPITENIAYKSFLFFFWRPAVLFISFTIIAFIIFYYMFEPMFVDIIILSIAWGGIGIIIGNIWHARVYSFSKSCLLISIYTLLISIFINFIFLQNAIKFNKVLEEIKSLDNKNIQYICINNKKIDNVNINDLVNKIKKSHILYVNHERSITEFKLSFILKNRAVCFPAKILIKHRNDIIISVRPYFFWQDIIIPQGALGLNEIELNSSI